VTYVFVGPHPDTLGDGTPLQLDQIVPSVNLDDPHNAALVAKGWLIPHIVPKSRPSRQRDNTTEED
jgi:hypothetical protein